MHVFQEGCTTAFLEDDRRRRGSMSTTDHNPIQQDDQGRRHSESLSAAPLDAATGGRLVFSSGAIGVTVEGEPALVELYRARFAQDVPGVHLERESAGSGACKVTIHYRQRTLANGPTLWREPLTMIALNGAIPWAIEFHGGVANLHADLRRL